MQNNQRRYRLEVGVHNVHGLSSAASHGIEIAFEYWCFPAETLTPKASARIEPDGKFSVAVNAVKTCAFALDPASDQKMASSGNPLKVAVKGRDGVVGEATIRVPVVNGPVNAPAAKALYRLARPGHTDAVGTIEIAARVICDDAGAGTYHGTLPADPVDAQPAPVGAAAGGASPIVVKVRLPPNDRHGGGVGSNGEPVDAADALKAVVASKRTLLYILQYKIIYQLRASTDNLVATLKREHKRLDSAPTTVAKTTFNRLVRDTSAILRNLNIAVQLAGQMHGPGAASAFMEPVMPNALPAASKGTVAELLQFDVLYQLQGATHQAMHVIAHDRDRLEIPLGELNAQHASVFRKLVRDVERLTHNINVIVQATIDSTLDAYAKAKNEAGGDDDYSDSEFSSSSSSSSSSSGLDEEPVAASTAKPQPQTVAAAAPAPAPAQPAPAPVAQPQLAAAPATTVTTQPAPAVAAPVAQPVVAATTAAAAPVAAHVTPAPVPAATTTTTPAAATTVAAAQPAPAPAPAAAAAPAVPAATTAPAAPTTAAATQPTATGAVPAASTTTTTATTAAAVKPADGGPPLMGAAGQYSTTNAAAAFGGGGAPSQPAAPAAANTSTGGLEVSAINASTASAGTAPAART